MLSAHLPCFNSWQQANVALFSYGVIKAESCQQGEIARADLWGAGGKQCAAVSPLAG